MKSVAAAFVLAITVSVSARADLRNTIIISDIDDTIQHTQVRPANDSRRAKLAHVFYLAKNVLKNHDAFVGMSQLYMMLAAQGAEFHYVSGAPKSIRRLPEKFLATNGFPIGELSVRESTKDPTATFKFNRITEIMDANPGKNFILIGDNGEKDVTVYKRASNAWRHRGRVKRMYIHDLYPTPIGENLQGGQKPFLTAADLALRFHADGMLTQHQVYEIARLVSQGLHSPYSGIRQRAFPEFATVKGSFNQIDDLATSVKDRSLRAVMMGITEKIFERHSKEPVYGGMCLTVF